MDYLYKRNGRPRAALRSLLRGCQRLRLVAVCESVPAGSWPFPVPLLRDLSGGGYWWMGRRAGFDE